ncbi:MAG: hypothetical protein ACODAU_01785 [Myxococcota bacterium]
MERDLEATPESGVERCALSEVQRSALLRHATAELDAGHLHAALDAARTLTALDPLFTRGWRLLEKVHRRAGKEAEAQMAAEVAEALEAV